MASNLASRRKSSELTKSTARSALGTINTDYSRFVLTFGAFSFTDAILCALDDCGPARIILWTWVIGEYDIEAIASHRNATNGLLFIDLDARTRERNHFQFAPQWREKFGADSVRYVVSHAKMALIESTTMRILIRGSANANLNPRCEQFDVSEGGPECDLVMNISNEYPALQDDVNTQQVNRACRVGNKLDSSEHPAFRGLKVWAK